MTQTLDELRNADVFDSRDVIERIEELEDSTDPDDIAERETLEAFAEDGEQFADWSYGETFIRDSYFTEYAQELAEDIGAIDRDAQWPLYCIDWEHAARDLRVDYSSIELDGITFWARS